MAHYTIKEMYDYSLSLPFSHDTLLYNSYFNIDPTAEVDTRPEYIKQYVDLWATGGGKNDDAIVRKYGSWIYSEDCESVAQALENFQNNNIVYCLTHSTELGMIYKAFTSDFNPVENYDRYEDANVHNETQGNTRNETQGSAHNETQGNAKSQTAPDDSEVFYNVGNSDSYATNTLSNSNTDTGTNYNTGTTTTVSHIHGNIGVTEAVAMIDHTVSYFGNNSMYDYLIKKLINDSCFYVG